jgi:hypothetical protein
VGCAEEAGVSIGPYTEAILDAISTGKGMNRDEGKTPTVVLLHPRLVEHFCEEIGIEVPHSTADFDAAPEIAGLALVIDGSVPGDEVCVLSDEDYLEHERMKAEAEGGSE